MKKVCERKGHERITWALLGTFMLGAVMAFAYLQVIDLALPASLVAGFCLGVYMGFIKLEAPKKKPKVEPQDSQPTPPSTK